MLKTGTITLVLDKLLAPQLIISLVHESILAKIKDIARKTFDNPTVQSLAPNNQVIHRDWIAEENVTVST